LAEAVGGAEALERVLGQPPPAGVAERVQGVVALQLVGLGDPGGGTHGLSCSDPPRGRSSTTSRRVLPAGSPSRSTGWGRLESTSTCRARNSSSGNLGDPDGSACPCWSGPCR